MSRRNSTTVEKINSDVAFQPTQDDPETEFLRAALQYAKHRGATSVTFDLESHQETALVKQASFVGIDKEATKGHLEQRPGADHPVAVIVSNSASPTIRKDVGSTTEEATWPKRGYRLRQLILALLKKMLQLLDLCSQEAAKEFGKEIGKEIAKAICELVKFIGKSLFLFLYVLAYLLLLGAC